MITTLKQLSEAERAQRRLKYPSLPEAALTWTKYSDKTANGLTKAIIKYFEIEGGQAERISVTGRVIDKRKVVSDVLGHKRVIGSTQYIPSSMRKGSADISCIFKGKALKLEVKIGRDRQSDNQKKYQADIEKSGGIYWIVTSWEDFINKIQSLCQSLNS